ncbi:MAG: Asp-tRNA(Asn)/Glu-tRNA(Gln) amidotransferase subunit GatC [Pseudomonadota bacterium]
MISVADIQKASKLAKIKLSDDETERLTHQIGNIMQMVQEMRNVDCAGGAPLASVCEQSAFMRDDVALETDLGTALFENVPGKDKAFAKDIKCFIVPKVVE